MQLSPENLVVIGLVASVVTQGLRLLANRYGYKAPREVVSLVLFAISAGLGAAFFGIPEGGDVVGTITALFGSAVLIYNVLLNKVLLPVASGKK